MAKYGALFDWEPKDVKEGYSVGNWKGTVKAKSLFWSYIIQIMTRVVRKD